MAVPTSDDAIPLTRIPGIEYGEADDRPLLLDAVYPQSESDTPRPPVVWVHGGSW
jgi:acetyl esterase/lipase